MSMSEMVEVNTREVEGAALDWAVAHATKAWKWAHEWFPTMTLDPTFAGVQAMVFSDGKARCQLVPNNPMRQDYQIYSPSSSWEQGGPLIDKYQLTLSSPKSSVHRNGGPSHGWGESGVWSACTWDKGVNGKRATGYHESSALTAAMRTIVKFELGDTVEVPKELVT